jgi:hypothetical protein
VDGAGREAGFAAHRVDDQQLAGTARQQADQGPHLGGAFDVGQLADVARDEIGEVGVEEALATARVRPGRRLRKTPADDALGVPLPGHRGFVGQRLPPVEDGIDEPVRGAVEFALGQRPQLDRLGPAGQRIRQAAQAQQASGAGQQVPAGSGVGVDLLLDGEQEIGDALDLVDHHELGGIDEPDGVRDRRLAGDGIIQIPPPCVPALGHHADQRALPGLPGPVDEHHSGVSQRLGHRRFGMPGQQLAQRGWMDAYHLIRVPYAPAVGQFSGRVRGTIVAISVVFWSRVLWCSGR